MAVSGVVSQTNDNVQIGITLLERFVDCIPSYFQRGRDGKLHHDMRKVNVFAHDKKIFGDSYGQTLKVENPAEFQLIKQRLLTQPTFLKVQLKKEKKSGNTRYITRGDFVIYFNTTNSIIREQLRAELERCEQLMSEGKNFALEIYRAIKVTDLDYDVHANVTYIEGVNTAERQQIAQMLVRAYVDGINAAATLTQPPRQPSAPPSYSEVVPDPPKYTADDHA